MKLQIAAFALLAAVTLATGSSECQWGPSFWCQSEQTAVKCGQVRYCQQNVWKTSQTPKPSANSIECDVCEIVVKAVDDYLKENKTESEVEDLIEELCSNLGAFADECDDFVNAYFKEIWNELVDGLSPDDVCAEIGVCSSMQAPKVPKGETCDICKEVCEILQNYVDSNITKEELKEKLYEICDLFSKEVATCEKYVDDNLPVLWKKLKEFIDNDTLCYDMALCPKLPQRMAEKTKVSVTGSTECTVCNLIVNFLKPYVDSSKTENETRDAVYHLCDMLPSPYKNECTALVKSYFSVVWALVKSEFDNDQICKVLRLCPSSSHPIPPSMKSPAKVRVSSIECDVCKLVVSFLQHFVDSNHTETEAKDAVEKLCSLLPPPYGSVCNGLIDQYFDIIWKMIIEKEVSQICVIIGLCTSSSYPIPPSMTKLPNDLCSDCKLVVSFIKPFVDSKQTEEEAEDVVKKLCTLLPSPYNNTCTTIVNDYFPSIWMLLEAEFENDEICKQLELCNNQSSLVKVHVSAMKKPSEPEFIMCALCEYVLEKLFSLIDQNSTKAEIEAAFEKVCDLLPSTLRTDCDDFVQKYGDKIIDVILQGVGPKVICTFLGLCAGEAKPAAPASSIECNLCTDVLAYVKQIVGENTTEKYIVDALEKVCNFLPAPLKDECDVFVKQYGGEVVQLIDNNIDPQKICNELKLCSSSSFPAAPWKVLAKAIRHRK